MRWVNKFFGRRLIEGFESRKSSVKRSEERRWNRRRPPVMAKKMAQTERRELFGQNRTQAVADGKIEEVAKGVGEAGIRAGSD